MKEICGVILMVVGVALAAYVGVWVCFIGGIVDVIEAIRAETLIAMDVAVGVAKVIFAGLLGALAGMVPLVLGRAML